MLGKSLTVAAGTFAAVLATGGSAFASDVFAPGSDGFGGNMLVITGGQNGAAAFDATVADARCVAPWYGSAVLGGSTPIGQMNVVCDDVKTPVTLWKDTSENAVLG